MCLGLDLKDLINHSIRMAVVSLTALRCSVYMYEHLRGIFGKLATKDGASVGDLILSPVVHPIPSIMFIFGKLNQLFPH